jgi:hypothetical protein
VTVRDEIASLASAFGGLAAALKDLAGAHRPEQRDSDAPPNIRCDPRRLSSTWESVKASA